MTIKSLLNKMSESKPMECKTVAKDTWGTGECRDLCNQMPFFVLLLRPARNPRC